MTKLVACNTFLVVSHDSIRGCVCPLVSWSFRNALDWRAKTSQQTTLCIRTCFIKKDPTYKDAKLKFAHKLIKDS